MEKNKSRENYTYELDKLLRISPSIDKDDLNNYLSEIDKITSDNSLNIIALIGDYGSGKSSLIRSYLEHRNTRKFFKEKYLFLSALPFKKKGTSKESSVSKEIPNVCSLDENELSKKIVEQIYNQCLNKETLKVRFRVYPYFLIFWISTLLLYLLKELIPLFVANLYIIQLFSFRIPVEFVHFITIILVVYSLINYLSEHTSLSLVNAIKLSSLEIELKSNNIDLSKVSTQLISLIKKTIYSKVIIEDLDRFDDFEVIYQLREFAYLYNNSVDGKNRKQFFFLLDNKNLTEEIRAKFFDYSLNVVPYYSKFNSFDFLQRVKKICSSSTDSLLFVSNDFLKLIAKHIDDSRIMRSVLIDYLFLSKKYFNSIGEKIESQKGMDSKKSREHFEESLLAATIYRHLFKDDYNCMLRHSGELYDILIASPSSRTKDLQESLKNLETELSKAEEEYLEDLQELRIVTAIKQFDSSIFKDNRKSTRFNAVISYDENNNEYKERLRILENHRRTHINNLLTLKEEIIKKIVYYTPQNDHDLEFSLKDKTNEKYFNLIKQMLKKGYLNQSIRSYTSYNQSQLLEEEQDLLLSLLDGENIVNPSIKIENCEILLTQVESDIIRHTRFINYDLVNFSRDSNRFQSHYKAQLLNIESKIIVSKNKIDILENTYRGMIREDNDLYDLLSKDISFFSIDFIDLLFDNDLQKENLSFLYQVLLVLLSSTIERKSWVNSHRESTKNIKKFFTEQFDINNLLEIFTKFEYEIDLFRILEQIRDYITQMSIIICLEKYLLTSENDYSNKIKDFLFETVAEKVKVNEFVVNGNAMKYLFYSQDFNRYSLINESLAEYLVSECTLTLESLDLSSDPFSLSEIPLIGLSERLIGLNIINTMVNDCSDEIVESLLDKMASIREYEAKIIDGKLELGEYSIVTTPFIDIKVIQNNDNIIKIIDNSLFYKNEDNIKFFVENYKNPKFNMSILNYFHLSEFIDVHKYKDVFSKELIIEIFTDLIRKIPVNQSWISEFAKNVQEYIIKISGFGLDSITFLLLWEYNLLIEDNDFYHSILLNVRNEKYITMNFASIVDYILNSKDPKELFIQFIEMGYCKIETVLNLMKQTGLFQRDVFSRVEIKFRTVRISRNSTRVSFKLEELNKEDTKVISLLERLGFIRKISLLKGKVTFRINWDNDID